MNKFRKIIGKYDVPNHFKIIFRYKKIGCNIDVSEQTACLVVNPLGLHGGRSGLRLNDGTILNLT